MKQCESCGVILSDNQLKCPLCHRGLSADNTAAGVLIPNPDYPAYPQDRLRQTRVFLSRIFLFLTIAAGGICLFINWMTWDQVSRPWSLLVIIPLLYLWVLAGSLLLSRARGGARILVNTLGLSGMLFLCDLLTGFYRWSVNLVIPFLIMAATVIFTIIVLARKRLWNAYIGYAITMLSLDFLPLLLYACRIATLFWPCGAAVLTALLCLAALAIFTRSKFHDEVVRRFHF